MKFINLTGQKFGELTVLKRIENITGRTAYLCRCDCGKLTKTTGQRLKNGTTKSCGCLQKKQREKNCKKMIEHNKNNNFKFLKTHSLSNHRLYKIWSNIKDRCYRQKNNAYKNYGARGIKICQEWVNDFTNFYNWSMANGYQNNLTIDRVNVNGNYEPLNCRWVDTKTQNRNTRQCVYYQYKDKKVTRGELADICGFSYSVIRYRLNNGWSIEDAITINTNVRNKVFKQDS